MCYTKAMYSMIDKSNCNITVQDKLMWLNCCTILRHCEYIHFYDAYSCETLITFIKVYSINWLFFYIILYTIMVNVITLSSCSHKGDIKSVSNNIQRTKQSDRVYLKWACRIYNDHNQHLNNTYYNRLFII